MATQSQSKKQSSKSGRNKIKCDRYRSRDKRRKSALRRIKLHLKRQLRKKAKLRVHAMLGTEGLQPDTVAVGALDRIHKSVHHVRGEYGRL